MGEGRGGLLTVPSSCFFHPESCSLGLHLLLVSIIMESCFLGHRDTKSHSHFILPPLLPLAAYKHADGKKIDGRRVLVDVERGRTVKGWHPRRLGEYGEGNKD